MAYRYYVEQAAALPGFLGAGWFIGVDESVTGRMDGENYNIGFLDVTDRAYPELVSAAKETFKRSARRPLGQDPALQPEAQGVRRRNAGNALDGRGSRLISSAYECAAHALLRAARDSLDARMPAREIVRHRISRSIVTCRHTLLVGLLLTAAASLAADASAVRVWETKTVIPTYLAGDPEPNPMFFFGRQSQGAQGPVYPYPMYDTLTGRKVDKTYTIVYLENEYIRIGVLPEVGGRIFEGVDKTNNYNFIYRQHVIKPALIGLIGAWISGGVEWNIPHHHRASTFIPVQYKIEENADGSKTIWVGELEVRQRMRWAVGYTLRPGKAILEASVRILNRTPEVNTMLCFANLAVHANDNYQVIFPPSTQFGVHHAKREFTDWPISHSSYGGADFSKGVDISWYKNHMSANSVFAWNYQDDFFAGYDHGKEAGTMSVADHNIVPGKKFWTWGNGPSGRRWDTTLTDDDGPYIELMVGAYSDNQPDYSWLQPYETRSFTMNWYPFRDIGGVKKANLDAAVNLDVSAGSAKVGFYATSAHSAARVVLKAGDKVLLEETVAINPAKPYVKQVAVPAGIDEHDLVASLWDGAKELVSYSPIRLTPQPAPPVVTPPPPPQEIKTNEELYLIGLRAQQFHDPNVDPLLYWQEALRRDPGDTRVNTVLGITAFTKARYADAEKYLRKALERLTDRYTTPEDADADLLPRRNPQGRRQNRRSVHLVLQGHLEPRLEGRWLLFARADRHLARRHGRRARFCEPLDRRPTRSTSAPRTSKPRCCAISAVTRRRCRFSPPPPTRWTRWMCAPWPRRTWRRGPPRPSRS